jgi:hypothetical protein
MKKGELKTTILKGYTQEKNSNTYTSVEEYHQTRGLILDVFFDVTTTKTDKSIKEGFSFYSDGALASYKTNARTFLNDFEYGEFGAMYNFDTTWNSFSNCNFGLNCSKNAFTFKEGYYFTAGKLNTFIRDCNAKSKGYDSSVCTNGIMVQYVNDKPEAGYINYRVVNEKASFDYEYEFQPQPAFN